MEGTLSAGRRGEQSAADYLSARGYRILDRNWRAGRYELDIVARRGDTIHFVEVKSRRRGSLTTPEEALTPAKFEALCRAARAWIAAHPCDLEISFDLAAVELAPEGCRVRHIPGAATPRW